MIDFKSLKENILAESRALTADVKALNAEVIKLSGRERGTGRDSHELITALDQALEVFRQSVSQPELIFATTGTTSSGKSTLVNLLCGAFIMPEAVGEMSAGVVEIKHGDKMRLEVLSTPGASWECGVYEDLSDADLQARLTQVMHAYNDRREAADVPDCPRITLVYPTRLGRELHRFGFPEGLSFSLTILDLPGLKHVGDRQNAAVIEAYCQRAMSFVTYNAAETDAQKQEALLKQVVKQVKEIGGTPARMMFVLNRFDVYEKDPDPQASKARAFDQIERKIREVLARELPEYSEVAQAIQPLRLSTKPALLAQLHEFKKIEDHFKYMVDDALWDDLPRKIEKWTSEQKDEVARAVLQGSYFNEFEEALRQHIALNLPEIIFPIHIARLKETGFLDPLLWSAHQISAEIKGLESSYEENIKELEGIKRDVEVVYADVKVKYERVIDRPLTEIPLSFSQEFLGKDVATGEITAIQAALSSLENDRRHFMDILRESIVNATPLPQAFLDILSHRDSKDISSVLDGLNAIGYLGEVALNGGKLSGTPELIKKKADALNGLSNLINTVLPNYLNTSLKMESKRITAALNIIIMSIMGSLFEKTTAVASGIIPLASPKLNSILYEIKHQDGSINLPPIAQPITTSKTNSILEKIFIILGVPRKPNVLIMPKIDDIIDSFTTQTNDIIEKYQTALQDGIKEVLKISYDHIVDEQRRNLNDFAETLKEVHESQTQSHIDNLKPWQALNERQQALSERIQTFTLANLQAADRSQS